MTTDSPALEFATDDTATGFRLHRLELLNWGTFNQHVWTLDLHGQNVSVSNGAVQAALIGKLNAALRQD